MNAATEKTTFSNPNALAVAADRTRQHLVLRRLARNRGAVVGAIILILLVLAGLMAPLITSYDPLEMAPKDRLQPPGPAHWFGTDNFGRDIFARVVYGTRISLPMGLISVGLALSIGLIGGLLSGYYGGWIDASIMRLVDILLAFPGLLLALAIIAALGPSLVNAMLAVGISVSPTYIRVVRATVLSERELSYVDAAHSIGTPSWRIIFRHLLPNTLTPVIVLSTLGVASAILTVAALSFLGLGVKPPTPEWGAMLSEARNYLRPAPWTMTFPGLAIVIAALAINLFGDGLRDALDPRMRL
jgi:peptide/nickel transport system permease protein